jgi:hypothetical protein
MMQNISESTKSENTPKRDIVDTTFHASCAPGTTRTNNMAFLLYGSGLNKAWHNEEPINAFSHFWLLNALVNGLAKWEHFVVWWMEIRMRSMRRISSMTSCLRLRLQGYMSALSVMAHAGGARSSFRGRNLCSSSEPSKGGSRREAKGSALKAKGDEGEAGEIKKRKEKKRE